MKIDEALDGAQAAATKLWLKSKTLWFNALATAIVALEAFSGIAQTAIGTSSPKVYAALAIGIAAVNFGLRWLTTKSVTLGGE